MKKKLKLILLIVLTLLPLLYHLTLSSKGIFLDLSNGYFMIAGFILIPSLGLWIIHSGTFDNFHAMWKKYGLHLFRPNPVQDNQEPLVPLSDLMTKNYQQGLMIGGFFLTLSLTFLILYLLF
ncbi:hypothetical protein CYJ27_01490 [Aerococcus christensenii]|uniref:DUF3899 domain-containing protein n=1 Tax=Aerococcus christensenii TaxID=87541 RepID=A0A2I1K974_9LACT|nr:DUF3899 domain-containing protein [Aerococcus christensenii]PKY92135.1 hypothetical protein CYJ27_01490 [Aerococcus christensenii]